MTDDGGGSHPYLGGFFLVAGAALLTAAFLPGAVLPWPTTLPSFQGIPGPVLAGGGLGVLMLVVGAGMLGGSAEPRSQPSEPKHDVVSDPERKRTKHPSTAPGGTQVDRSGDPSPPKPQTKEEKQMDSIEEKIDAIDRRMSQAKVKLGTGELSPEGYQKVMEDLEEKRAELEKRRVDLELDQSDI